VKDKIYNPDVDAKIVDGKGNSFIVSIKTFPTATKLTAKQQMESTTNQEMEEQFNAVYGTAKVIKRGSVFVGLNECYYIHLLTPFQDGLQLYHIVKVIEYYQLMRVPSKRIWMKLLQPLRL
jgi:hypothetical protein